MPNLSQIASVAYPLVLAKKRKATNVWFNGATLLRECEKQGMVVRKKFGNEIHVPIDFRENPDAGVVSDDTTEISLTKTEVVTSAVYQASLIRVPVKWTVRDEAKSHEEKVDFMKTLSANGLDTHDSKVETYLFDGSAGGTDDVLGLDDLAPTSGQGTVGTIVAGTDAWWRNPADTYTVATILADMQAMFTSCERGSGSKRKPTLIASGADPFNAFFGELTPHQRFIDSAEAAAGFTKVSWNGAAVIYSAAGGSKMYFLSPASYQVAVSSSLFRQKGAEQEFDRASGSRYFIHSMLQAVALDKSGIGVLDEAAS